MIALIWLVVSYCDGDNMGTKLYTVERGVEKFLWLQKIYLQKSTVHVCYLNTWCASPVERSSDCEYTNDTDIIFRCTLCNMWCWLQFMSVYGILQIFWVMSEAVLICNCMSWLFNWGIFMSRLVAWGWGHVRHWFASRWLTKPVFGSWMDNCMQNAIQYSSNEQRGGRPTHLSNVGLSAWFHCRTMLTVIVVGATEY